MTDIIIREAKLSELSELLAIEQLIVEAERPFEENFKQGRVHYYDLEKLITNDNSMVLVAETENQIIATGYVKIKESLAYLKDNYHAYLGFMYVNPSYRGQGINQRIIEQLKQWSKEKGMTVVCLEVLNGNTKAINAYRKSGFNINLVEMRINLDD